MRGAAALATALIFAALTLLGVGAFAPAPLQAQTSPKPTCAQLAEQNAADLNMSNPTYVDVCTMKQDMQADFHRIVSSTNCGKPITPGGPPLQCGFVAPASGSVIKRALGEAPTLAEKLSTTGATSATASLKAAFTFMLPSGLVSWGVTDVTSDLNTGPGSTLVKYIDIYGNQTGSGLVTKAVKFSNDTGTVYTSGRSTNPSRNNAGEFGVRCEGTGTIITSGSILTGERATDVPVRPAGQTGCRFYARDQSDQRSYTIKTYPFGPELFAGKGATVRPTNYAINTLTAPERATSSPAGATQVPPHETRIAYDTITSDPSYNAPAPTVDPQTDPNADPDHDGDPNKTDPDDDGDGQPDELDPDWTVPDYPPWQLPEADPDQDGQPNEGDTDDDGDGQPDEWDPYPYDPSPPLAAPESDPDKDGEPNETDPDDDNDGIPDEDDPSPFVPTDPATLPRDNPSADPDQDGQPNKSDPDDDGDGTPDEQDPEPYNPNEDGDLDDDGLLDKEDGDQDGDGTADWEDVERRQAGAPVSPNATPADADEDTVPDWSDPWPGNPYAPAEPTQDGDGDKVPDYKDPEIQDPNVPMQPWPPGSPGTREGNPGEPNIPPNPSNPNYPTSPNKPAQPSDPTSPISPTAPISPSEPMPPGEAGGPPPTTTTGGACEGIKPYRFKLPKLELFNVFPFSLVLKAWNLMSTLVAEPKRPTFELPGFGTVTVPDAMDQGIEMFRVAVAVVMLIGMLFMFYRTISGTGGGGSG